MTERRPFHSNCVSWPSEEMPALEYLIEHGEDMDIDSFVELVDPIDWAEIVEGLGYGRGGLKIEDDYHVRFKRDPETGIPFMVHSAIEFVFAYSKEIDALCESRIPSMRSIFDPGSKIYRK